MMAPETGRDHRKCINPRLMFGTSGHNVTLLTRPIDSSGAFRNLKGGGGIFQVYIFKRVQILAYFFHINIYITSLSTVHTNCCGGCAWRQQAAMLSPLPPARISRSSVANWRSLRASLDRQRTTKLDRLMTTPPRPELDPTAWARSRPISR